MSLQQVPQSLAASGVQVPMPGGTAQVVPEQNQLGKICAQGTASRPMGNPANPTMVYAMIYANQQLNPGDPNVPGAPPGGAASMQPNGQNWSFARVSGAAYGNGGNEPWNTLVIWARYQDPNNPYDLLFAQFQGLQANMTDCGGS